MLLYTGNKRYEKKPDHEISAFLGNNEKRILAIDFDGVFVCSDERKSQLFREKGYDIPPEMTSRDSAIESGVPKEVYTDISVRAGIEINETGSEEEGLGEYWPMLRSIPNLSIVIVTSRYDHMLDSAVQFMISRNIYPDGILNVNNEPKRDALAMLKPASFVDDVPSKLYELFEDPETCEKPLDELAKCDIVLFRNRGMRNQKEFSPMGKIIDLKGGWDRLFEYAKEKFS